MILEDYQRTGSQEAPRWARIFYRLQPPCVLLCLTVSAVCAGKSAARVEAHEASSESLGGAQTVQQSIEVRSKAILPSRREILGGATEATVYVEVRYKNPVAEAVDLIWGLNQWSEIPKKRPRGTFATGLSVMHSPMRREGDAFVAELEASADTRLDFCFEITKASDRDAERIWRDPAGKDFVRVLSVANADEIVDPDSGFSTRTYWLLGISLCVTCFFALRVVWHIRKSTTPNIQGT